VDEAGIYVTWTTPAEVTLMALDHKGNDKWRRSLGPFKSMHGSGTSPIVCGELVVLANDQRGKAFLIAVDHDTGETRWRIERKSGLTPASTPCVFRSDSGQPELIFTSTAHGITSVNQTSGTINWEVPDVFEDRCVGSPVVGNGLVFGAYGYGTRGTRFVAVRPGSKDSEPEIVYDITESVPLVPTPIVEGNRLFLWADNGSVTCANATTGEIIWRRRVAGSFYGSPVYVGGRLYCMSRKGDMVVLAASDEFRELGRGSLGEPCCSTPAIGNKAMYIRTYSHLLSIRGN
jgi:outer membrane protein assembly factor BamB